jgi:hypothetical protein
VLPADSTSSPLSSDTKQEAQLGWRGKGSLDSNRNADNEIVIQEKSQPGLNSYKWMGSWICQSSRLSVLGVLLTCCSYPLPSRFSRCPPLQQPIQLTAAEHTRVTATSAATIVSVFFHPPKTNQPTTTSLLTSASNINGQTTTQVNLVPTHSTAHGWQHKHLSLLDSLFAKRGCLSESSAGPTPDFCARSELCTRHATITFNHGRRLFQSETTTRDANEATTTLGTLESTLLAQATVLQLTTASPVRSCLP